MVDQRETIEQARALLAQHREAEPLDVYGAWLVETTRECTCAGANAHEPGCGSVPITTHPVLRIMADPATIDAVDAMLANALLQLEGAHGRVSRTDEPGAVEAVHVVAAAIVGAGEAMGA